MALVSKRVPVVNISLMRRCMSTGLTNTHDHMFDNENENRNLSRAMKAYKMKAEKQRIFMAEKIAEFDIGKRHLANMMGENVETFTQDDIDASIAYLLPSGLFQKMARPMMKPPEELYPKLKKAEFDDTGRPFHTLFYTSQPTYFKMLQEISIRSEQLDAQLHKMEKNAAENKLTNLLISEPQIQIGATNWMTKIQLSSKLFETISDKHYEFFINSMNRLISHPLANRELNFVLEYREKIVEGFDNTVVSEMLCTEDGIPYVTNFIHVRHQTATVTVYGKGSGKISINGGDLTWFENQQEREQVLFPLQFTGMLRKVDVVATSTPSPDVHTHSDPKKMGQAYGIRHALSFGLVNFVSEAMAERMKLAGLLTHDMRQNERKYPGRKKARKKFTWKKR